MKKQSRIAIYLIYDRDRLIDDYVGYMLKELRSVTDYLLVVSNGIGMNDPKGFLTSYADEFFERENIGYDVGAFKDAITKYIGWERVYQYDELVLINDSFFGPFKSMKEIFKEADERTGDFWGLIKHGQSYPGFQIEEHIQSFFLAVRGKLLRDKAFQSYFSELPYFVSFDEVVKKHEIHFTKHFERLGFRHFTLADTDLNDGNEKFNYSQYESLQYELIKYRNFPFLKKQCVAYDNQFRQSFESYRMALDYIDRETDYDVGMIWKNMIRTMDMGGLVKGLNLQFILPEKAEDGEILSTKRAVLIFTAMNESVDYQYSELLSKLCLNMEISVLCKNTQLLPYYQRLGFRTALYSEESMQEELKRAADADYVCMLRDYDTSGKREANTVGKSLGYNACENLLSNVDAVLSLFEKNPYLGALIPPKPIHENYFSSLSTVWGEEKEMVSELVREMNLHCVLSPRSRPIAFPENIWIRAEILRGLVKREGFSAGKLRYIWQYAIQDAGCYMAYVESSRYASMYQMLLLRYLSGIENRVRELGEYHSFREMDKLLFMGGLHQFQMRYSLIYVYGTGIKAREYTPLLQNISGYIVSDGQAKPEEFNGRKVYYLSEIEKREDMGIVVCTSPIHQPDIVQALRLYGVENFICI